MNQNGRGHLGRFPRQPDFLDKRLVKEGYSSTIQLFAYLIDPYQVTKMSLLSDLLNVFLLNENTDSIYLVSIDQE
jgi:hypothetical protein